MDVLEMWRDNGPKQKERWERMAEGGQGSGVVKRGNEKRRQRRSERKKRDAGEESERDGGKERVRGRGRSVIPSSTLQSNYIVKDPISRFAVQ